MHRNFFWFEQQIIRLQNEISAGRVLSAFTVRKNEAVLELEHSEERFLLHISVDVRFPYLLKGAARNFRQPKFNLFPELTGQHIQRLEIIPFDKHVRIQLDDFTMDMIFYGANPNIHLYDKERRRIASFKQRPESAAPPPPGKARFDFRHTEPRQLAALCKQEPKQKWSFALKRHFYALSGSLYKELLFRSGVHPDTQLEAISSHQIGALSALFKQVAAECNSGQAFLYYRNDAILSASLVELTHLNAEPELRAERFDSINKAWWKFISLAQDKTKTDHLRALCRNALQKRQRYLERSLQKMTEAADLRARKELAELKGNLLLTFQHEIEAGASAVTLKNIFSDQAETIQIKLNPAKSVVENATRYFTKYKQMDKQKEVAAIKQSTLRMELNRIAGLQEELENARPAKVNAVYKQLIQMKMVQEAASTSAVQKGDLQFAFKRVILEQDWDIFIGKNGANNDLLTFEFAHKWDLWLHAQGVPGSHVIIRLPGKNVQPPRRVIERAAAIAASNSKARFSASVPVMVTEVRFVSRIRKALPGTVSVRNEEVLFVEPLHLN